MSRQEFLWADARPRRGRPRVVIDLDALAEFRARGESIRRLARTFRVSIGTIHKALREIEAKRATTESA